MSNSVSPPAEVNFDALPSSLRTTTKRLTECEIYWDSGALEHVDQILKPSIQRLEVHSLYVLIDPGVEPTSVDILLTSLKATGLPFHSAVFGGSEGDKSIHTVEGIWKWLHDCKAQRRSLIIAIGGGVLCDVTAFAAATYMRGVPYALVPTTVLAQADAALGGKGGADLAGVKNLIGAFHQPICVIVDFDLIRSLPREQISNGMAEIVKVALIADPLVFGEIERVGRKLLEPGSNRLPALVKAAGVRKLALLEQDPFEIRTLRRPLNLGHCLGHPLESATNYAMRHGFAVARGICWAAAIAADRGITDLRLCHRVQRVFGELGLPTTVKMTLAEQVWARLDEVRRIRNGEVELVLPVAVGEVDIVRDVTENELIRAAELIRSTAAGVVRWAPFNDDFSA